MPTVTYQQANQRYRRRFLPLIAAYSVICFGAPAVLRLLAPAPWALAAFMAVITAAPIAAVFWLLARFLHETDEYTRHVQGEAMLSGGAITFALAVLWSFLELYRVVPRFENAPSMMMVGPAFFFFYGASYLVQQRRRGTALTAGGCSGRDA